MTLPETSYKGFRLGGNVAHNILDSRLVFSLRYIPQAPERSPFAKKEVSAEKETICVCDGWMTISLQQCLKSPARLPWPTQRQV
mmetsp:Transcript_9419/g.19291  ORF Transcript_9419/g.19291 Transcript_9419/m.19291 type:complete len:84 (-) Transcript_9419:83-334(-)